MIISNAWGSYSIDDSLHDETMYVYRKLEGEGGPFALVIHRDFKGVGQDAAAYVDKQTEQMKQTFGQLVIRRSESTMVAGRSAHILQYTWSSSKGAVEQTQVFVPTSEAMIVLTLSASPGLSDEAKASLEKTLSSFTLPGDPA